MNPPILNVNGLSKKDKLIVQEALTADFSCKTLPKGWRKLDEGFAKIVYKKDNFVVKLCRKGDRDYKVHFRNEVKLYKSIKPKDHKFFARIYAYNSSRIVQKFIKGSAVRSDKQWNRALFIADKYDIDDVNPSNFKIVNNVPIFFDFGL